jgi:1-aminocyclopropane-1-carboxylate deaminase/D-cysteine desulfhydrase-like pyridoxal-dependent ACC family enzyme
MTAAAARAAGMRASLVLTSDDEHPPAEGNLLLDQMLGAEIHLIPANPDPKIATGDQEAEKMAEVAEALRARGERPYVIPVGGSSAVGTFGYVAGTLEIAAQLWNMGESPSRMYFASGSRGTQAGLTLGAKVYEVPYKLCGMAVSGGEPEKTARAMRIANEAADLLGCRARVTAEDLATNHGYIGTGYGVPTAGSTEAISLLAQTEGIFLDPVYSAKAMAGLIDEVRRGLIPPSESILFVHTGGTPALFAAPHPPPR